MTAGIASLASATQYDDITPYVAKSPAMLNDSLVKILLLLLALLLALSGAPQPLRAAEHKRAAADGVNEAGAAPASCVPAEIVSRSEWPEPIPSPWQRWRELMGLGKCHLAAGRPRLAAVYFRMGLREGADS